MKAKSIKGKSTEEIKVALAESMATGYLPTVAIVFISITKLKNREQADAGALLIFSCVGRLAALGPLAQQENEGLAQVWGSPRQDFIPMENMGVALMVNMNFILQRIAG